MTIRRSKKDDVTLLAEGVDRNDDEDLFQALRDRGEYK